jgi:NitT/TauT family transport system substrate-binding protein
MNGISGHRFATTLLLANADYLAHNRDKVRGFLQGHVALTRWIQQHPEEARQRLAEGIKQLTGKPLPDDVMRSSLGRIDFLYDPMIDSVRTQADWAYRLGFLGAREPDLSALYDLTLLSEVTQ